MDQTASIPGEVFTHCESTARELYRILQMIWSKEYVPPELVRASFVMLFKNKGSSNDPSKTVQVSVYRPPQSLV